MSVYKWPANRRARVWRERFPLTGEWSWAAGKPGGYYICGQGFHFDKFTDAIAYATSARAYAPEPPLDHRPSIWVSGAVTVTNGNLL